METYNQQKKTKPMRMSSFTGKTILSFLRQDDYAHAGEEEAIEKVMRVFLPDNKRLVLDVGCGLGGTAKFIENRGWGEVVGVDIDPEAIAYAKTTYPHLKFYVGNAEEIDQALPSNHRKFDLICLFNVFYAVKNQLATLKALWNVAHPNARLVIFDYVFLDKKNSNIVVRRRKEDITNQGHQDDFFTMAAEAHWKIDEMQEIDNEYKMWYRNLLTKIANNKDAIIKRFGNEAFITAKNTYSDIYQALENKTLGGTIIYATAVGVLDLGQSTF